MCVCVYSSPVLCYEFRSVLHTSVENFLSSCDMKHDKISDVNGKLLYRPVFVFAFSNVAVVFLYVLCLCLHRT